MQHDAVVCLSLHTLLDHSSSVLQVRIMRMRSSSLKMGRGELVTDMRSRCKTAAEKTRGFGCLGTDL